MVHRKLGTRLNGHMVTETITAHTRWVVSGLSSIRFSHEAGAPNISGTWKTCGLDNAMKSASGAFIAATWGGNGYNAHGAKSGSVDYINFSAKNSNSIYGASTTIVPLSRKCKYFINYI